MCVQGNAGQTSTALPLDEEEEEEEAASGTIPFTVGYNSRGNQNKARQVDTDIVIGMNQERRQASAMAIGVGVGVGVKGGVASAAADGMLAGPASKDNGGSMDCTPQGLMAYGAGSSVVVVDTRSMQLVTVLPMPPHGAEAGTGAGAGAGASSSSSSSSSGSGAGVGSQGPLHPASFVTAVRFSPQGAARWPAQEHKAVVLAVGDRQGRIAIWDVTARAVTEWLTGQGQGQRQGVQELCWFNHGGRSLIVVVHGASLLSAWNVNVSGQGSRCVWRYDASPEVLACVRADPFDSRHACVVGVRGALLSLTVTGDGDSDIILRQFELQTSEVEGSLKGEKDAGSASQASPSPAMVLFPNSSFKCRFSLKWPNIVFIMFPREFIVFDLQYGAVLSVTSLPWGYSKLLDVIVDIEGVILCCVHVDGKLSMWKRKEGKQVYVLCTMQALMPSLGTSVPSPAILSVSHCSSEFEIEKVGKICSKESHGVEPFTSCAISDYNSSSLLSVPVTNTTFISISDDGKVWKWLLTAKMPMHVHDNGLAPILSSSINAESGIESTAVSIQGLAGSEADESKVPKLSQNDEIITKIKLVSQLHLLPAAVTTLAVPSPSLIATLPGGGNDPAVAVPLVALATQAGSIEVVDVAATAIVASFSVHSSAIRGLRWLGNSKLVSFSFSEANDRGGGYVNRLAVTCVRSGLSRFFRVTQKLEKAPMRAIRASPSGRYLIILFREAPAEIWAMTRDPQMLRSLALPFSVVEWALPPVPKPQQKSISRQSSFFSKARPTIASTAAAASVQSSSDTKADSPVEQPEEMGESFAFALVNGSVGVFEVRGRRVKDFRPKWPPSSFISSDVLITAMAYRMPHVVMGDRHGNIRWWDVKTGLSSSFNTYRGSIRRIKFAPVVAGDHSRGRVAVLFTDNTFSIYDLDTQDPLANAILQPHFAGILVLELDWFPLRLDKKEPLLLCISGADSSFRLLEVTPQASKSIQTNDVQAVKSRFQPMSFCSTSLLPAPHALAFRMLLQWGVKEFWFNVENDPSGRAHYNTNGKTSTMEKMDYRNYILQTSLPQIGDNVAVELLLKILEPYRNAGQLLDKQRAKMYSSLLNKGCTARFAFAAALFGEHSEATFWLQLPHVLSQLIRCVDMKFTEDTNAPKVSSKPSHSDSSHSFKSVGEEASRRTSQGSGFSALENLESCLHSLGMPGEVVPSDKQSLCANARERISWHENIGGEDALQKHIHELISVGDLESAVNLSLSTPPESPYFYADALRAVALSSAVSQALHELAVKVVAANMVSTDKSLSGTHLLCAVGRYQEACSQLQDAGYWTDAATLAATHLKGSDYSRVLQRWAYHVLHNERNIWRALILFVAAGLLHEALAVLRDSREPNTAVMFLLSCHEIKSKNMTEIDGSVNTESPELNCQGDSTSLDLPGDLNQHKEDVLAVCEFYGQYQRDLVHLCTELAPVAD